MDQKVLYSATLVYPVTDTQVLLARKQRRIGQGRWNGYGGDIEPTDASPEAAALREFFEESGGLVGMLENLQRVAVVDFHNRKHDGERFTCRVYIFLLTQWEGKAETTPEMADPTWFRKDALPLDDLMLADSGWLPQVLAGSMLYAEAWYGLDQQSLDQLTYVRVVTPDELNRL